MVYPPGISATIIVQSNNPVVQSWLLRLKFSII